MRTPTLTRTLRCLCTELFWLGLPAFTNSVPDDMATSAFCRRAGLCSLLALTHAADQDNPVCGRKRKSKGFTLERLEIGSVLMYVVEFTYTHR
jgi:hypothetical protein